MAGRPRVLIEEYIPIEAIGAESLRDASAAQKPPLNRLHVWWARRPLTVSRAAILASLLPAETDPAWLLDTMGIKGDPAAKRAELQEATRKGINLGANPYGYARAFTYNPEPSRMREVAARLRDTWGTDCPVVLDPFSGGGSIPFEAMRLGFEVKANELNPVAAVILEATLEYPARFGEGLASDISSWGKEWAKRARADLERFFPVPSEEKVLAYVWAHTVRCPDCGLVIPLSPNWWLDKSKTPPVAARLVVPPDSRDAHCTFEVPVAVRRGSGFDPAEGTCRGGDAQCPRCRVTVDGAYIKSEAQSGRMGSQLYAVVVDRGAGREYRAPNEADLAAVEAAEKQYREHVQEWLRDGFLPGQLYPENVTDTRPLQYGMDHWYKLFSPRQALVLSNYVRHLKDLKGEIRSKLPRDRADAVITYLAIALDKSADYNSRMTRWHSGRAVVANTFDRHDFAFKWSYGEFDGCHQLLPWAVDQVADAYGGLARLLPAHAFAATTGGLPQPSTASRARSLLESRSDLADHLNVTRGNAADLGHLADSSVHLICADPPYYDNVMYGELSDFFYVWESVLLQDVYPDWFQEALVGKDEEAVANPARFAGQGRKGVKDLAKRDYEAKMQSCFREAYRVLHPQGAFTIMFTHKSVDAWDTLAAALIDAGFEITASWPVHTESDKSLHQAKKNAAQSTVLLVCRKREDTGGGTWFDDILGELRQTARNKAASFQEQGLRGVDLYISTFGPALQVLSQNWPVKNSDGTLLRPEQALDVARAEVTDFRFRQLLAGRHAQFDPPTEFAILAWDIFRAVAFPFDEARKLAMSVGADPDDLRNAMALVQKASENVKLLSPAERRRTRPAQVNPEATSFPSVINAVHTATLVHQEDGPRALEAFFRRTGLWRDTTFLAAVEALLQVVPQTKATEAHFRPLYDMAQSALEAQIKLPQLRLFDAEGPAESGDEEEEV